MREFATRGNPIFQIAAFHHVEGVGRKWIAEGRREKQPIFCDPVGGVFYSARIMISTTFARPDAIPAWMAGPMSEARVTRMADSP